MSVWSPAFETIGNLFGSDNAINARPVASPYFVGVEAALNRVSAKTIVKARAAGLEPVGADDASEKELKNEEIFS